MTNRRSLNPLLAPRLTHRGRTGRVLWAGGAAQVVFIALHLPLGVLLYQQPTLSTLHALLVALVGIGAAILRPRDDLLHLYMAGYIVGAEVMWRITDADVFHEFGKYAVIAILGVSILRRLRQRRLPALPVVYVACLLPATLFWLGEPWDLVRNRISFNLSGPLSLAVCAIYFAQRRLQAASLKRLAVSVIAPAVATAAIGAYSLMTAGSALRFGLSSSKLAVGGAGPNQVSNLLALGAILGWLLLTDARCPRWLRLSLLFILFGLITQAILSFSRGGVLTAALSIVATVPFLVAHRRSRIPLFVFSLMFLTIFVFVVLPWIIEFTGGMVALRYGDLDTTYRMELGVSEIWIWLDNPLAGVGPGRARYYVGSFLGFELQPHVEYTRMLAEHGLPGLLALVLLIWGALSSYRAAAGLQAKAWVAALLCYAFAYMGQAAMRTVAPGFVYGLTWAAMFQPSEQQER